jgi:1,4-dihydroxy-2-naphthoyl-CoA hydrolase
VTKRPHGRGRFCLHSDLMADLSQVQPEQIRDFAVGSFPADIGIEPLEIEDDHARGRIMVESRHLHPGGFVHGGVWTALGDTVAAWATFRAIPPGYDFTTIELKLNVFGAGRLGDEIVADARPLHAGRSTAVIEVRVDRIREGNSKLAANLIVSQFVIAPGLPLDI